ncbi:hypothetical protein FB451DRAFT_1368159 [Mycena latifolia]|nr:hypothetical protein FB451DRAFT_1368159 [Mycena latifolia]
MNTYQSSECYGAARNLALTEGHAILPRHHNLLATNEAPTDSEQTFIRSVVSETGTRLKDLEKEMSQLRDRLAQLEEEHASLSAYHSQNVAVLSPLRRMPPEVLCEIFSWTLPSVLEALRRGRFDVEDSPWVLTHISSRWRAVALSTPSLWSQIVVDYSYDHDLPCSQDTSEYPLSMVEAQIQRAQKLKIHFYGCTNTVARPQVQMFQYLAEHSSRWEEFSVELTPELTPLLPTLRNRVSSLCRLWIQWHDPESREVVDSIDCFEAAPCLVDFGMNNDYARPVPILLPTHQLTGYQIDCPWSMHHNILQAAQSLVEARIELDPDEESWTEHGDILDALRLQHLFVSHTAILNRLRAPALKEIAFYHDRDDDPNHLLHLQPFVVRSCCTLQKLSIKGLPTGQITAEILQKYPSITQLAIILHQHDDGSNISYEVADTLISLLSIPNPTGDTPLSPQLSEICFGCEENANINYSLCLDMLESRWKSADCVLKSAAVLTASDPGPDLATLNGLHMLRQDGLDLLLLEGKEAHNAMDLWIYSAWDLRM